MMLGYYGSGFANIASIYGEQRFSGNELAKDELAKQREKREYHQSTLQRSAKTNQTLQDYLLDLTDQKDILEIALAYQANQSPSSHCSKTAKRRVKGNASKAEAVIKRRLREIRRLMGSSS